MCLDISFPAFTQPLKWVTWHHYLFNVLVHVVGLSSSLAKESKKADNTKTGVALAALNLPGGPAYTKFTEELFHTEQFQVGFKQTRSEANILSLRILPVS